jgi:two-component system response regulator FixJ
MLSPDPLARDTIIKPTVFIIDDDDAVRNASQTLIESMDIPTRAFSNVQSFLDSYDSDQPGCLLLEVRLPQMSGLELQEYLGREGIDIPIIFISGHSNVAMAVRAIKAGAIDFLEKPFDDQMLLDSIQKALEVDKALRHEAHWRKLILQYLGQLSRREEEVLRLLIQGKPNKVIAHEMILSTKTVETHRAHIMRKLGVNSLAGLVWMALTSGEYREIPDQLPFPAPAKGPGVLSLRHFRYDNPGQATPLERV